MKEPRPTDSYTPLTESDRTPVAPILDHVQTSPMNPRAASAAMRGISLLVVLALAFSGGWSPLDAAAIGPAQSHETARLGPADLAVPIARIHRRSASRQAERPPVDAVALTLAHHRDVVVALGPVATVASAPATFRLPLGLIALPPPVARA